MFVKKIKQPLKCNEANSLSKSSELKKKKKRSLESIEK